MVSNYASAALAPFAKAITRVLEDDEGILSHLTEAWATSIARLCIGLRQRRTGGAFLLTPNPSAVLQVTHPFAYPRFRDAAILAVLDKQYLWKVERAQQTCIDANVPVPPELVIERGFAETDEKDRDDELTGAVKLVASLAAVDGLVLMTPELSVAGFGVKIGSTPNFSTVYDGPSFSHKGTRARKIDASQFGTRHGSILRYCAHDPKALGIVVSQDGYVRLVMTVRNRLVFWNNIKLLDHTDYSAREVARIKSWRESQRRDWKSMGLGYTHMPKTMDSLLAPPSRHKQKQGAKRR